MLDKGYPLEKSPLFSMLGRGQLERAINLSWDESARLLKARYYRVWTTAKKREVQQPLYELDKVHKRIANLLSRIEMPEYVFSKRGRSYINNAEVHSGVGPLVKTDLNKFYPSTTWAMVYRMFLERFKCAEDISARLADICCFQQSHLPTGSSLSGYVAFFAAQPMFDRIFEIFKNQGCTMTLFVDDLTASGVGATPRLLLQARSEIRNFGFKTRDKKSKSYEASKVKQVTGVILAGQDIRVPNKQYLKVWQARAGLSKVPASQRPRALKSLDGRLKQIDQILNAAERKTELEKSDSPVNF